MVRLHCPHEALAAPAPRLSSPSVQLPTLGASTVRVVSRGQPSLLLLLSVLTGSWGEGGRGCLWTPPPKAHYTFAPPPPPLAPGAKIYRFCIPSQSHPRGDGEAGPSPDMPPVGRAVCSIRHPVWTICHAMRRPSSHQALVRNPSLVRRPPLQRVPPKASQKHALGASAHASDASPVV